jgi:hypothetical protein
VERKWNFNAGEDDYCSLRTGQRYICGGDIWANLYEARDHHAFIVIGHPVQLQHYMKVLGNAEKKDRTFGKRRVCVRLRKHQLTYMEVTTQSFLNTKSEVVVVRMTVLTVIM